MRCSDIMKTDVACVTSTTTVEAASRTMRDKNVGFLPVCDDSKHVLGTITDRDIVVRVMADGKPGSTTIDAAMTKEGVCCRPGDEVYAAEKLMAEHQKSRMLVCDDGGVLVGVISLSDIAHHERTKTSGRVLSDVTAREAHH